MIEGILEIVVLEEIQWEESAMMINQEFKLKFISIKTKYHKPYPLETKIKQSI
jgi:hypothetical protein